MPRWQRSYRRTRPSTDQALHRAQGWKPTPARYRTGAAGTVSCCCWGGSEVLAASGARHGALRLRDGRTSSPAVQHRRDLGAPRGYDGSKLGACASRLQNGQAFRSRSFTRLRADHADAPAVAMKISRPRRPGALRAVAACRATQRAARAVRPLRCWWPRSTSRPPACRGRFDVQGVSFDNARRPRSPLPEAYDGWPDEPEPLPGHRRGCSTDGRAGAPVTARAAPSRCASPPLDNRALAGRRARRATTA